MQINSIGRRFLTTRKKTVSLRAVIRAGKKDERRDYLAYNLMILAVFGAIILIFFYLFRNPEIVSKLLTGNS